MLVSSVFSVKFCVLFWCILHYFIGPEPISSFKSKEGRHLASMGCDPQDMLRQHLFALLSVDAGRYTTARLPVILS